LPAAKTLRPSAADLTREFIDEHPSIRSALAAELLNYSALARKIQAERGVANEEAVTIGCRRYERALRTTNPELERVKAVVRLSRLEVHSRVAVIRLEADGGGVDSLLQLGKETLSRFYSRRVFQVYEGAQAITILVDESALPKVLAALPNEQVRSVEEHLSSLVFRSRADATETPGILAYMAEALFEHGVNCLETVSVHSDTIFVFRDTDLIRAYQVLGDLVPIGGTPVRSLPAPRREPGSRPGSLRRRVSRPAG
jgi:hypothetical protein